MSIKNMFTALPIDDDNDEDENTTPPRPTRSQHQLSRTPTLFSDRIPDIGELIYVNDSLCPATTRTAPSDRASTSSQFSGGNCSDNRKGHFVVFEGVETTRLYAAEFYSVFPLSTFSRNGIEWRGKEIVTSRVTNLEVEVSTNQLFFPIQGARPIASPHFNRGYPQPHELQFPLPFELSFPGYIGPRSCFLKACSLYLASTTLEVRPPSLPNLSLLHLISSFHIAQYTSLEPNVRLNPETLQNITAYSITLTSPPPATREQGPSKFGSQPRSYDSDPSLAHPQSPPRGSPGGKRFRSFKMSGSGSHGMWRERLDENDFVLGDRLVLDIAKWCREVVEGEPNEPAVGESGEKGSFVAEDGEWEKVGMGKLDKSRQRARNKALLGLAAYC